MLAEQAVFTSLSRRGKAGYHLVARSPGLTEPEAATLAAWSPSHGALIVDAANRVSVNFHPLPGGRFAVSRTCEGRSEYSGRGGRQLYTHALVIDPSHLRRAGYQPFAIYRDALAQGHFVYRADPEPVLAAAPLSTLHPSFDHGRFAALVRELGPSTIESVVSRLDAGQAVEFPYAGDRTALAEFLTGRLSHDSLTRTSFTTSLLPSAVRPYRLNLIARA